MTSHSKVNRETAIDELNRWFEAKKISAVRRESSAEIEDELIEAITEGYLTVNDDNTLTQKLKFPLQMSPEITELKFAFRMNIGVLNVRLKGIKVDDTPAKLTAYISALTDQSKTIISALDTVDNTIASSIAVYFF